MPPWYFLYLRETQKVTGEGEEEGEGENVNLKTHATARSVGKQIVEGNSI